MEIAADERQLMSASWSAALSAVSATDAVHAAYRQGLYQEAAEPETS